MALISQVDQLNSCLNLSLSSNLRSLLRSKHIDGANLVSPKDDLLDNLDGKMT